jgi:hypothetical protein
MWQIYPFFNSVHCPGKKLMRPPSQQINWVWWPMSCDANHAGGISRVSQSRLTSGKNQRTYPKNNESTKTREPIQKITKVLGAQWKWLSSNPSTIKNKFVKYLLRMCTVQTRFWIHLLIYLLMHPLRPPIEKWAYLPKYKRGFWCTFLT